MRTAVAGQGYEFIFINATTGLRTISPALATNTQIARESGDLTGFYHWSQTVNESATTADKSDPVGEAKNFLANAKVKVGDLVALDHEQALGTWAQRVTYALGWLRTVAQATGAKPLIYLNFDWIKNMRSVATAAQWAELTSYPLWLAEYTGTAGQHSTVKSQDGTSQDCWPILVHQYAVTDGIDRDWTPNLRALKALGATKEPS